MNCIHLKQSSFQIKKYLLIISVAVICIIVSRKKSTQKYYLGIDVQSEYNNDQVKILIDNEEVLNKSLTTNNLLGVCNPDGQLNLIRYNGKHQIKVTVNDTISQTSDFTLTKNRYIGINYNPATQVISFVYSDTPFIYE